MQPAIESAIGKSMLRNGDFNLDSARRTCFTTNVLVKDLGLENGNSVQTPATPEVKKEEKPEPLSQVQHHKYRSQVARCFVLQPRPSRHNIHRERVVPENVKSHSAESCQVEEACQMPETREAVGTSVLNTGKLLKR